MKLDVAQTITVKRLHCFGHVLRMHGDKTKRKSKRTTEGGRQRTRWIDTIKQDCEKRGMNLIEVKRETHGRGRGILRTSERATASPRREKKK